jgi:dolichyl-diphosphooligosaccharide--protein glycosyltransferase
MLSNAKLFSVGDFDFRLQHLLIIGILAISVSTSALLRAQPADYGFQLHEFDPFFNYRATEFIVNNGYEAYFEWHDEKSWYPLGRNVSASSQAGLHLITATFYNIFGGNSSLYDFTIMFPLVIGSLTCIVVFALVRVIGGTTAGLIASLMFAVSLPIILRGFIGWFKSEPLGLFLGFIGIYLFVSAIKTNKGKTSLIKLIFGGIFIGLGFASWGGIQFFLLPLAAFIIALPFFRNDNKFLFWAIPTFAISLLLTTLSFERPGISFVWGYGGFLVILPTLFMMLILTVQKFSSAGTKIRNSIIVLGGFAVSGLVIIQVMFQNQHLPSFRYLNAVNPFLSSKDPLVSSIAEHQSTSLTYSFEFLSIFIIFGLIGAWLIFSTKSKNPNFSIPTTMKVFALIFGFVGIYTSSAFIRLELFGSIALMILGSVGLTILLQHILQKHNMPIKIIFCAIIIGLFIAPMVLPENTNWITYGKQPPPIYNGATFFKFTSTDWLDATAWLKENTPDDSVVFSWWDYGYWITTLSDRTTLVDNATFGTAQIQKVAKTFLSPVNDAWVILDSSTDTDISEHLVSLPDDMDRILYEYNTEIFTDPEECLEVSGIIQKPGTWVFVSDNDGTDSVLTAPCKNPRYNVASLETAGLDADYIVIYVAGQRYETDSVPLYEIHGGADESKIPWWITIAEERHSKYYIDGSIPNKNLLSNTLIGNLLPFSIITYLDPNTMEQYSDYRRGLIPIYVQNIKFHDLDGPFTLAYASPNFSEQGAGLLHSVLIYKVNHEFVP